MHQVNPSTGYFSTSLRARQWQLRLDAIAGNTGGEIHVYDSMGSSDLPEVTKQQIAVLIFYFSQ